MADSAGLFLQVAPSGARLWRYKYRFDGKEKLLALGKYPAVSLKDARLKRDEARLQLANDVDPGAARKAAKASRTGGDSFEAVAREFVERHGGGWVEQYRKKTLSRFEKQLFPYIGNLRVDQVASAELLAAIRKTEDRGLLDSAHRLKQLAGQVFRYAVATGRAQNDPSQALRGALPPKRAQHMATTLDPEDLGALLRAFETYSGTPPVCAALKLAPILFVRPRELRMMEWAELDLENAMWSIPAAKMKMRTDHVVPLASQAVAILRDLRQLTGHGQYVFPSERSPRGDRCMSENAVLGALRRLGIGKDEQTGHGFRATARTLLDEQLQYPPHLIEHQLAHTVKDPLGRAYNRTTHLKERREMMQAWADYLDSLRNSKIT